MIYVKFRYYITPHSILLLSCKERYCIYSLFYIIYCIILHSYKIYTDQLVWWLYLGDCNTIFCDLKVVIVSCNTSFAIIVLIHVWFSTKQCFLENIYFALTEYLSLYGYYSRNTKFDLDHKICIDINIFWNASLVYL